MKYLSRIQVYHVSRVFFGRNIDKNSAERVKNSSRTDFPTFYVSLINPKIQNRTETQNTQKVECINL